MTRQLFRDSGGAIVMPTQGSGAFAVHFSGRSPAAHSAAAVPKAVVARMGQADNG